MALDPTWRRSDFWPDAAVDERADTFLRLLGTPLFTFSMLSVRRLLNYPSAAARGCDPQGAPSQCRRMPTNPLVAQLQVPRFVARRLSERVSRMTRLLNINDWRESLMVTGLNEF